LNFSKNNNNQLAALMELATLPELAQTTIKMVRTVVNPSTKAAVINPYTVPRSHR
jgi:hypothetical protein